MPKRGFTLIELLVVISIIAVLSALVMNNLRETRARTRDVKRVSDLLEVQKALELYRAHNGRYPALPGSIDNVYGVSCWECGLINEPFSQDDDKLFVLSPYLNPRPSDPLVPASGSFDSYANGYWYKVSPSGSDYKFVLVGSLENINNIPANLRDPNFGAGFGVNIDAMAVYSSERSKTWTSSNPPTITPW